MSTEETYRVRDGALIECPAWEDHSRGRNWLAKIEADPRSPGGLSRVFADRANGDYYYIVPDWEPGTPVEFGADYYSGRGRRSPHRWYGVITATSEDGITILPCENAREAMERAARWEPPESRFTALENRLEALLEEGEVTEEDRETLQGILERIQGILA